MEILKVKIFFVVVVIILQGILSVNSVRIENFVSNLSEILSALNHLISSIIVQDLEITSITVASLGSNFSKGIVKDSINQLPRDLPVILIDQENRSGQSTRNFKSGFILSIVKNSLVIILSDELETVSINI